MPAPNEAPVDDIDANLEQDTGQRRANEVSVPETGSADRSDDAKG